MSVEIIAELGNAHNGDLVRAHRLIDAAKACGATTVKWQCYSPDELVELRGDGPAPEPWGLNGWTMRKLYEKAQTPFSWFKSLTQHATDIGLPWFSSVFGTYSLELLESLDCPRYKLAALDFEKSDLTAMVRQTGKPILRSCPNSHAPYYLHDTYLLAPPGYPQQKARLGNLRNGYDGYSYHGRDLYVPVTAVAVGARIVECHFQLDKEPNELESNVSLGEEAFTEMAQRIRYVQGLL